MTTNVKSVVIDGVTLGYLEDGPTNGPVVLCLHGFPDTASTFDRIIYDGAFQGCRVIRPFLPGYYPSDPVPTDMDLVDIATLLGKFAQHFANEYTLVAHDWGTTLATIMINSDSPISRYISIGFPPLKWIKITPGVLLKLRHFAWFRLPWLPERLFARNPQRTIRKYFSRWSPQWRFTDQDVSAAAATVHSLAHARSIIGYYRLIQSFPLGARAKRVRRALIKDVVIRPSLYIGASQEGLFDAQLTSRFARTRHPWHAVLVEGGHFLQQEKPKQVAGHIARYLAARATQEQNLP